MNLSFLDTLADLASREQENISSSSGRTSDLSTIGEINNSGASLLHDSQQPLLSASFQDRSQQSKRLRAYSESFVRDREDNKFDWEATKQRLLLLSANSALYNEHDIKPSSMTMDNSILYTQQSSSSSSSSSSRSRSDSEIEEDQSDMGLGNNIATTSMLERYDRLYNKGGRIGIYTREERFNIIKRFHEKRKKRVWKKKIRYHCRKNLADRRLRVKGRFIKAGSDAYFALQAQGVIDEQGQLVLSPIDEGEGVEGGEEGDDDDDEGEEEEEEGGSSPNGNSIGARSKTSSNSAFKKQQLQKEKEVVATLKEKQQKQKQQAPLASAAKKQLQIQQAVAKARSRSNSMEIEPNSSGTSGLAVSGSPTTTATSVSACGIAAAVGVDSGSGAIFGDMVRSPKSENAARNSLSLLLSMADGDGSSVVNSTSVGASLFGNPGVNTAAVTSAAGINGNAELPPFMREAAAAGVNTGTSVNSNVNSKGPMLGLYLLGRAISTDNLAAGGGAGGGGSVVQNGSNSSTSTGSNGISNTSHSVGIAAGAGSAPPTDSEMIALLLSSKRMRRHSIAY